jgi:hypothetical protein
MPEPFWKHEYRVGVLLIVLGLIAGGVAVYMAALAP